MSSPALRLRREVADGSCMSVKELAKLFEEQIKDAKEQDVLLSLYLTATMMTVPDQIMSGYRGETFLKDLFAKHAQTFRDVGMDANLDIGDSGGEAQGDPSGHRGLLCEPAETRHGGVEPRSHKSSRAERCHYLQRIS